MTELDKLEEEWKKRFVNLERQAWYEPYAYRAREIRRCWRELRKARKNEARKENKSLE